MEYYFEKTPRNWSIGFHFGHDDSYVVVNFDNQIESRTTFLKSNAFIT